jgi:uncharacterized protein (TIGR01777 family)
MSQQRLRIVLPGGSGHVGQMLARHFLALGHQVTVLTRSPYTAPWETVHWDGERPGSWTETLEGADVCINLAGRSVNCRYTAKHRQEIHQSRIGPTGLLSRVITSMKSPPRVWMNMSTATIYRHSVDHDMDEATGEFGGRELVGTRRRAPDTWDFSVGVAKDWEALFFSIPTPRTRKIALRSAVVMSPAPGGAFAILLNLVRASVGGTQGNGRQYVSWIHEADFARAIDFLIAHDEIAGPVNLAAPNPLPNREFMRALRDAWDMPNGIPAPWPLLQLATFLMRTEPELVLKSRRVVPARLLEAGFDFDFRNWQEAADDLVRQWRNRS